jgi:hypothetical protein
MGCKVRSSENRQTRIMNDTLLHQTAEASYKAQDCTRGRGRLDALPRASTQMPLLRGKKTKAGLDRRKARLTYVECASVI